MVIDADGLNLLAREKRWPAKSFKAMAVLTPHPGEMAAARQADRPDATCPPTTTAASTSRRRGERVRAGRRAQGRPHRRHRRPARLPQRHRRQLALQGRHRRRPQRHHRRRCSRKRWTASTPRAPACTSTERRGRSRARNCGREASLATRRDRRAAGCHRRLRKRIECEPRRRDDARTNAKEEPQTCVLLRVRFALRVRGCILLSPDSAAGTRPRPPRPAPRSTGRSRSPASS